MKRQQFAKGEHEQHNRHRDPQKIADVLTDLFAQRGYAQIDTADERQSAWTKIVGDLSKYTIAGELRRGVLQILVSNSVVMQELTFRKQGLLAELKRTLPKHKIKDVRFRLGKLP